MYLYGFNPILSCMQILLAVSSGDLVKFLHNSVVFVYN